MWNDKYFWQLIIHIKIKVLALVKLNLLKNKSTKPQIQLRSSHKIFYCKKKFWYWNALSKRICYLANFHAFVFIQFCYTWIISKFFTAQKYPSTEIFWSIFCRIWTEYGKIRTRKESAFKHFLRSVCLNWKHHSSSEIGSVLSNRPASSREFYFVVLTH